MKWKDDVIIVCFPILDEWKDDINYQLDEMKSDVIIVCFPMLDEMKRMTS